MADAGFSNGEISPEIMSMMIKGAVFWKHDFGRNKRSRKKVVLSKDGLKLSWSTYSGKSGGGTDRDSPSKSGGGMLRSASFGRSTTIAMNEVTHIIYGPYTDTFSKKSTYDRVDPRWACFSLVMGAAEKQRTVDFAAESEEELLPWLLGLQQTIAFWAKSQGPDKELPENEQWSLPKLHLQKLRLKVSGETDKTGQGPYDVVLSAVLDVASEKVSKDEGAMLIQKNFRRRNVQGKFQTAVQEMMEINGLVEDLAGREDELKKQQDDTASKIAKQISDTAASDAPPRQPSDRDMKDPKKMQEYMLQMGEYSARQQLKMSVIEPVITANQQITAELQRVADEKRKLENLSTKLLWGIQTSVIATLEPAEAQKVLKIQESLGVTPRSNTITDQNVRVVTLYKESVTTRLGIIFYQQMPDELQDADITPRIGGKTPALGEKGSSVVLPVIKVLDPTGVAGAPETGLNVGDQVIMVNGQVALSNVEAVKMLRSASGTVELAVRSTKISMTPRGNNISEIKLVNNFGSGLKVVNQ